MASFNPAHDAIVMWALDATPPTESTNGSTAATLPAAPTPFGVLGYTDLPQGARGLNNSQGFAIGQQGAAYLKRGAIAPSLQVTLRPGTMDVLENLVPDPTTGKLPYLCLFVIVKGEYTNVFRYCKPDSLAFDFSGGDGQDGEITITIPFQAIAFQRAAAIVFDGPDLLALGDPLMWHDVRQFSVANSAGTVSSYRKGLISLRAEINYGLERKNVRPNWGDGVALSRTSYDLLEHHTNVSGEIGLHERMAEAFFTGTANAQNWGDIVIWCSDSPLGLDNPKGFTLTLVDASPSDESMSGGESNSEIDYSVPFTARSLVFELDEV